MSFTIDVKKELCTIKYDKRCCIRAHLAGLASFCGAYTLEDGKNIFKMRTESQAIARRAYSLIKELSGIRAELTTAGKICQITVLDGAKTLLTELGFLKDGIVKFSVDPFIIHDECCKIAFLSGAFLGGGYVKTPKNGYHFEIKTHYRDLSRDLAEIIEEVGFETKTVIRKSEYVVYIKQSDVICDILGVIGATEAMLELCNIKILKDVRNNITRKVNCDTANISKTADAAAVQLVAINKIKAKIGLEAIPEPLEKMARLRLQYPEANLTELSEMLVPKISKSGVNQRLKKIIKIAEEL